MPSALSFRPAGWLFPVSESYPLEELHAQEQTGFLRLDAEREFDRQRVGHVDAIRCRRHFERVAGWTWITAGLFAFRTCPSCQFRHQGPRVSQISRVKALSKPAVYIAELSVSFICLALLPVQTRQTHCGPQFE